MGKKISKPLISFSGRKNRVYISRDVLRLLDNPSHICLYMNEEYNSVAIGPCTSDEVMSFKVPEKIYQGMKADFTINSQQFVTDVMRINHMDLNTTYRIIGQHLEGKNAVTFQLRDAQVVAHGKVSIAIDE